MHGAGTQERARRLRQRERDEQRRVERARNRETNAAQQTRAYFLRLARLLAAYRLVPKGALVDLSDLHYALQSAQHHAGE